MRKLNIDPVKYDLILFTTYLIWVTCLFGWVISSLKIPPPPPTPIDFPVKPTHIYLTLSKHTKGDTALARIIHNHATRESIDPRLIANLIRVESAFNPRAVGPPITITINNTPHHTNAIGLGQIVPEFWLGTHPECGSDLFNPLTNICYTVLVYKHYLNKYSSPHRALLAYNGCQPGWSCDWYAPEILAY